MILDIIIVACLTAFYVGVFYLGRRFERRFGKQVIVLMPIEREDVEEISVN